MYPQTRQFDAGHFNNCFRLTKSVSPDQWNFCAELLKPSRRPHARVNCNTAQNSSLSHGDANPADYDREPLGWIPLSRM
jgi:hypothetical protein